MPTKLEALKTKLDKQAESLKTLKEQIEQEELGELQQQEFANKVVDLQEQLKPAIVDVIEAVGVDFPMGRTVTIDVYRKDDEYTISVSALVKPAAKTRSGGNGGRGRETIMFEGKKLSWSQLADLKGISYGGGSAHKAIFTQDKELHDSIEHKDCPYV